MCERMDNESRETYCDLHNDGWPESHEASLYCVACSRPFIPEGPDVMDQRDDDCLCAECASVTKELEEGLI